MRSLTTKTLPLPVLATKPGIQSLYSDSVVRSNLTDNLNKSGMELLIAGADIGMWTLDQHKLKINLCDTAKALFGFPPNHHVSLYQILKTITADTRKLLLKSFGNACSIGTLIDVEIELNCKDIDDCKWLKIKGRLQNRLDEAPDLFMGTITDISGQKQYETWNSDGLAILSHELRSPLTTIKLYVQMVTKIALAAKDDQSAELLGKADSQVSAMTRMMEDHLALSVLQNSSLLIYREMFDMIALLNEICAEIQLKSATHRFVIEFDSKTPVFADRSKIAQVVVNYLNNAVKYSEEGSLITVKCCTENDIVRVSVIDQGVGIKAKDQVKLFKRYQRTPGSKAHGNGLGLYLSKEIINLHGGNVGVTSKPGAGSTFYFSLPR